jgi:pilus assembly protein CpaF
MTMYSESLRAFLRPVLPFLDDDSVSEILINGPTDVWIERKGKLSKTEATFSEEGLLGAARNMAQFVGRTLNDERPRMDARLPDGSRIHVVLPPLARHGPTISIRKFFRDKLTVDALLRFNSLIAPMARLIEAGIHSKLNALVAGGTGSGKTTLLNILSSLIPAEDRILTIEDSAELQLQQPHVVSLETRPPDKNGKGAVEIGDLLNSALRLRPDRIIVGEVRGGEAFHLMQALNTGHGGSLATLHANTPVDTLRRLESLCLMSSVELPLVAVRAQVASAIQLIVCCERFPDGSRRVISLSEVLPLNDKGEYRTQDLFVFTPLSKAEDGRVLGYHAPTGLLPTFLAKARAYGFSDLNESFFDPATYGVPPPPSFHQGEAYAVRWAPSLKHRERGEPDPDHLRHALHALEQRLKEEARSNAPSSPGMAAPAPARPQPKAAAPAARPPPRPAPPVPELSDEDKTPPPTRNAFSGRPPPPVQLDEEFDAPIENSPTSTHSTREATVQVSEELLREDATQGHAVIPQRPPARPSAPPLRPAQAAPAGALRGAPPPRRPLPGSPPARPPPPVLSLEDEAQADSAEKTHIRSLPEKPRR